MSKPDFRKRDDNRRWWVYTLELEHTGFVKQGIRDHPCEPPFGEKRGETKGEREEEQSVESRMPQNATKAHKILYGPGGTDWTGPMARAERHCNAKYVRGSKNASTSYTYKRA